ncbi:MAG TPA: hypothetical protein VIH38_12850 [Steroidobacteraceae bacterium]|jgi:hypothetical protein
MSKDHPPPGKGDERERDPDNAGFRRAIDNIFKEAAKRVKEQAEDAARRGRKARNRANDAEDRQARHKPDR